MNRIVVQILRFILLLTIQILICNHIHLFRFINPYIYILALLLLPVNIPRSWQYIIGFVTGFIIDSFTMTYGVHASASLMLIFVRPYLINLLNRNNVSVDNEALIPGVKDFRWLFLYTFILTFLHHLWSTFFEIFSLQNFACNLLTILINAFFTTMVILSIEYIFMSKK
jgi:cell shape-determining protein MreD